MAHPHLLFVTGKLAEPALSRTLTELAPRAGFDFRVAVLPITVAALATTPWIARHLHIPPEVDRVILPGLCAGDLTAIPTPAGVAVERGPQDLLDLPEFFGAHRELPAGYGAHDIAILAEINHVPRLPLAEIVTQARAYRASGADLIDLGCDPGVTWTGAADTVRALRGEGLRVSIDSFNPVEVEAATAAGAELVLSVNSSNRDRARSWGCEVVAIPDVPATLEGLDRTIEVLREQGVPFRIDPVLEPIGFGFAASLGRYLDVRRRYPGAAMMMGIGNLTELTDVDSAGVNVMLLGFCQEVGIRSVLTTEVINWCRSSVRELDLARRLVYYACKERVLPKHLAPELVRLRDPKLREHGEAMLKELAERVTDRNLRLFAERGLLLVLNGQMFLQGTDPFALFAQMHEREAIDSSHAFYLGYEMAKAVTALTLGKNYVQDQALRWGFLTSAEHPKPHESCPENG
jgi:dihydropteroate synthase-like protein